MSKKKQISELLNEKLKRQSITNLCKDDEGNSMIKSNTPSYKFDKISSDIKTSDTIFINEEFIEFIEFKNRNLEPLVNNQNATRNFQKDLRLKVIESYISLSNFLNENGLEITLDDLAKENLNFSFVFNREKFSDKPNLLVSLKANQEQWKKYYYKIYTSINFIDNVNFQKKYNLEETI